MRAFARHGHGADATFSAEFEPDEAGMLHALAEQIGDAIGDRNSPNPNPALLRILPDAYPDDAEASAEFRRFTIDDLAARKVHNGQLLTASLGAMADGDSAATVLLNALEAQAWIRVLTDIRLAVALRLGITNDEEALTGDTKFADPELFDLYEWLGFVQSSLVDELANDLDADWPRQTDRDSN